MIMNAMMIVMIIHVAIILYDDDDDDYYCSYHCDGDEDDCHDSFSHAFADLHS